MQLRAIATDVDRTLTDETQAIDLDAIRTIRLLERAGVPVILSSGRDIIALGTLAPYLGASGVVVAEDGAIIGRFGTMHYQTRLLARPERAHAAVAALEAEFGADVQVLPVPSRFASLVLTKALDLEAANRFLAERGLGAKVIDSGLSFELADADVDKGTGLIEAAAMLGVRVADIAAIGDSPNDIGMFRVAGWSAAVGNAEAGVKAAATYACRLPYGQGFVEAVRHAVNLFRPDLAALPWPEPVAAS